MSPRVEVVGAEVGVHEDVVCDGGVGWWRTRGRGKVVLFFIFYFITLSCAIVLLVVSKDEVLSCAHTSISLVERH